MFGVPTLGRAFWTNPRLLHIVVPSMSTRSSLTRFKVAELTEAVGIRVTSMQVVYPLSALSPLILTPSPVV